MTYDVIGGEYPKKPVISKIAVGNDSASLLLTLAPETEVQLGKLTVADRNYPRSTSASLTDISRVIEGTTFLLPDLRDTAQLFRGEDPMKHINFDVHCLADNRLYVKTHPDMGSDSSHEGKILAYGGERNEPKAEDIVTFDLQDSNAPLTITIGKMFSIWIEKGLVAPGTVMDAGLEALPFVRAMIEHGFKGNVFTAKDPVPTAVRQAEQAMVAIEENRRMG